VAGGTSGIWRSSEETTGLGRVRMGKKIRVRYLYEMWICYRAAYRVSKNRTMPRADTMGRSSGPSTKGWHAVPALSTIDCASSRAKAVVLRVVPHAWPI
jgi:hypothetical protein